MKKTTRLFLFSFWLLTQTGYAQTTDVIATVTPTKELSFSDSDGVENYVAANLERGEVYHRKKQTLNSGAVVKEVIDVYDFSGAKQYTFTLCLKGCTDSFPDSQTLTRETYLTRSTLISYEIALENGVSEARTASNRSDGFRLHGLSYSASYNGGILTLSTGNLRYKYRLSSTHLTDSYLSPFGGLTVKLDPDEPTKLLVIGSGRVIEDSNWLLDIAYWKIPLHRRITTPLTDATAPSFSDDVVGIKFANIIANSATTEEITLQTGEILHWALVKRYGVGILGLSPSPTPTSPVLGFLRIYGTNTDLRVHELRASNEYPTSSDPWAIVTQVGSLAATGRITVEGLEPGSNHVPYGYTLYVQKSKGELYSTIRSVLFSAPSAAAGKVAALEAWKRGLSIPAAYDDTELRSKITALETRIGNLSSGGGSYDDTELRGKITALETRIGNSPSSGGAYDDTELRSKITALETRIGNLSSGGGSYDDTELRGKIKALEKRNINTIVVTKGDLSQQSVTALGLTKKSVVIVPNPVQQTLRLTVYQGYDYIIRDSSGLSIKTGKTSEGNIDVSELPAGTYVLQLKSTTETYALQFIRE